MTNFLVVIKSKEFLRLYIAINPHYIPVLRLFRSRYNPSELFSSNLNDIILSFGDIDDDLILTDVFHTVFDKLWKVQMFAFGY